MYISLPEHLVLSGRAHFRISACFTQKRPRVRTQDESLDPPSLVVYSHTTPKPGLWLNPPLDVHASITHSTQGFFTSCSLLYTLRWYINYFNIWVVLRGNTVRLHPILDDLGCIPPHCINLEPYTSTENTVAAYDSRTYDSRTLGHNHNHNYMSRCSDGS